MLPRCRPCSYDMFSALAHPPARAQTITIPGASRLVVKFDSGCCVSSSCLLSVSAAEGGEPALSKSGAFGGSSASLPGNTVIIRQVGGYAFVCVVLQRVCVCVC